MKAEYGLSVEVAPNSWRKVNLILDGKEGETPEQLLDRVSATTENWFNGKYAVITVNPGGGAPLAEIFVEKFPQSDPEVEAVKKVLLDLPTKEEAEAYLKISGVQYNVELKNIVNQKPNK